MNIYIYGVIILFSLPLNNLNGQNLSSQTDLNEVYAVIKPLYNGEIDRAKLNHSIYFSNDQEIESIFLKAQILRWERLPIYQQEDTITDNYLQVLNSIISKTNINNDYENYIQLSAYLLLAEFNYNNNSLLDASNYGRKAYNLLKNKLTENQLINEWLLPVGLYNYFYSYYLNKNFAFQSLLYFFKNGEKETGLMQLHLASNTESLVQGEALIYLSHIYLRLENNPEKAWGYAQKLIEAYPDNLKFYEFYIETSIALNKVDETTLKLIEKLKYSDQIYYQKYGIAYSVLTNIIIRDLTEEEKSIELKNAINFIRENNSGNHLLSLLYRQMAEITDQKKQYIIKLNEVKIYEYKLTKL